MKKSLGRSLLLLSALSSSYFPLNAQTYCKMPEVASSDSVSVSHSPEWFAGLETQGDYVIPTDAFYSGSNSEGVRISGSFGGALRGGFRFNPESREGMLYPGIYQGVAVGVKTFFRQKLMGTPAMAYVFQGAPFHHFNSRLHLGYEWKFGIACGWHHATMYDEFDPNSPAISTAVTAHMGVALKLQYDLTDHWQLALAIEGTHHSNGNTSWRNAGLNAAGVSIGASYIINPLGAPSVPSEEMKEEADRKRWFYDIMAFGSWRQRVFILPSSPYTDDLYRKDVMAPGKFPVFGIQFAPAIALNRWVAVGPALDAQWDKSADLARHWIEQPLENGIEFSNIPFKNQISVGLSAHAELTTPIFTVNAGIGYNVVNPKGDEAFYQSLTVKTFVTRNIFLNVGYRLGGFKDPHNIMLGIGYRIQ